MNPIDLNVVNHVSPYPMKLVGKRDYEFVTSQGITYTIGFIEDDSISSCESYQFYITKETLRPSVKDEKIKMAVLALLENFFDLNTSVLVYICDTSDGKEELRSRLFLAWFRTYACASKYVCKDAHVKVEDTTIYAAIIVRKDNPFIESIVSEFDETSQILSDK